MPKDQPLPVLAAFTVPKNGDYANLAQLTIARVFSLMHDELARTLTPFNLSVPHFEILLNLDESEGLTQQELAERLLVTKANVCVTLDKMEKLGLAERRPDPSDRRVNRIYPTSKGRATLAKVRPTHAAYINKVMSVLEPREQKALYESLTRVEFAIKSSHKGASNKSG